MVYIQIILNHYRKVRMIARSKIILVDHLRKVIENKNFVNLINKILLAPINPPLLNPFYLPSDITSTNDVLSNSSLSPTPTSNIESIKSSPQRPIRRCNICQQEFRNKALLRLHMNTFHSNDINKKLHNKPSATTTTTTTIPFSISPTNNLGFLQPYVDTASPLAHKLVAGQAPPTSYGILHDSYFCAKMADRVVCEICNKQVCNKYFLKTHKGKKKRKPPNLLSSNQSPLFL